MSILIGQDQLNIFEAIIKPLKENLNLSFGYMIVFKDKKYFMLISNQECQREYTSNVKGSCIFCKRNITGLNDNGYNFTTWPDSPINGAGEIYAKHNYRSGITVSRTFSDYTELWWFCPIKGNEESRKLFIINKGLLLEYINYFNTYKRYLLVPKTSKECLYEFKDGFDISIISSAEQSIELKKMAEFSRILEQQRLEIMLDHEHHQQRFRGQEGPRDGLSSKEVEILSLLSRGLTSKLVAQEIFRSHRTVEHHIENIKTKLGLHYKNDLIRFYNDHNDQLKRMPNFKI